MKVWHRVRAVTWRFLRPLWLALRSFSANQGNLRAGGLTYLTMLALVPALTVVLAIAGAFGIKEQFYDLIGKWQANSESLAAVKTWLLDKVEGVKPGVLGAFGLPVFVYTALSMLARVEQALNVTWQADRGRTLARRYADYVALLFLVPLLVLVSTGLRTLTSVGDAVASIPIVGPFIGQIVESGLQFLPLVFICMAITLIYRVMPNVRVRWVPALIAGAVAGCSWYVAQSAFLYGQVWLSRSNAIYGSLALLPFLMLYLYLSWTIVLWGGELSYVIQHRARVQRGAIPWSPVRLRRLALALVRAAGERFAAGKTLALADFSGRTGWPRTRVDEVAELLVRTEILRPLQGGQAVVPAQPPGTLPLARLLTAIDGIELPADSERLDADDEAILARLRDEQTNAEGEL